MHLTIVSIFVLIKVVLHYIASLEKLTLKNELKALETEFGGEGEMGFEGKFSPQHRHIIQWPTCFLCG